jgi:phosphomethylpyrimidine synthase
MITTEDVPSRKRGTTEQGMSEDAAFKKGMEAKSKEFVEKGAEVYAKA